MCLVQRSFQGEMPTNTALFDIDYFPLVVENDHSDQRRGKEMDFQGSYSSLTFDSDAESIEFEDGAGNSADDDSFSLHFESDEEEEENEDGYHRWYLQQGGTEFNTPITFEDGMDYSECVNYYQAQHSQTIGGVVLRVSSPSQRCDFLEQLIHRRTGIPKPCLKVSGEKEKPTKTERPAVRRCSFSGLRDSNWEQNFLLNRSKSAKNVKEQSPRVSFKENAKVFTIHPANEYPTDIRLGLWMTREEMAAGVRSAVEEEARAKRRKSLIRQVEEEYSLPVKEKHLHVANDGTENSEQIMTFPALDIGTDHCQ